MATKDILCKNCSKVLGHVRNVGPSAKVPTFGVCKDCAPQYINGGAIPGLEDMTGPQARAAAAALTAAARPKKED